MEPPPKLTVLFLEDDADTRDLVKFTLETAGIKIISAQTVAEAWQIALQREVDLYLLDGLIPHGDSLKLCADIRTIEPDKPIVFYSGLAYKDDILKGMQAGATAYLTKPYSGDLAEEILRYIGGGKSQESVEPLFMDKQNVPDRSNIQPDATSESSVRISEFGAGIDREGNVEQFGQARPQKPAWRKLIRTARTTGGIF